MKQPFLLPNRWKIMGWLLTLPALAFGLYFIITNATMEYLPVPLSTWARSFIWYDSLGSSSGPLTIYIADELICLGLLAGLLILGLAREKTEDERTQQLRLGAFQWAMVVNAVLLAGFIIFTHGMPFLNVMIFNMFTPLLLFVGRFYYTLRF